MDYVEFVGSREGQKKKKKKEQNTAKMVIGMLLALTTCPALLGTQEAIRQSQSKNRREEHRAQRCNLIASCVQASTRSIEINNKIVVLRDSKVSCSSVHLLSLFGQYSSIIGSFTLIPAPHRVQVTCLRTACNPRQVLIHSVATSYHIQIRSTKASLVQSRMSRPS